MQRVRIIVIGVLMTLAISGVSVRAQKSDRLAVGYGSISTNYLPLWMAREAGIFRKNGLDVDTVFFTSSPTAFMALLAGETAITINPGPDVVNAHLAGADVVFVAGGTVALDWWLVSRPEIKTPSLLRGGAVGISRFGSSSEFIARYALQKIGLTPGKDATIVQIGSPLSRQAAMDTGKVQATVYTAIHTFTAEKKGFNVLADLATLGLPYQNAAVVTTRKLIREKPEIIGRFVRSQLEAVHLLKTDRENVVKVLAKNMQGLNDREVLEKAYDRAVAEDMLPRKQYPSLAGIKTVLDALGLPQRKVVVLESDGSLLFGLNSLATVAMQRPDNLAIIVFDNECYESIGGAPGHTAGGADLAGIAREAGIRNAATVRELDAFSREAERCLKENALSLLVAKIEPSIADVPPRYYHLFEERNRFVRYIEETERISVLRPTKLIRRDPTKWGRNKDHRDRGGKSR